jgi:hypothetical protein
MTSAAVATTAKPTLRYLLSTIVLFVDLCSFMGGESGGMNMVRSGNDDPLLTFRVVATRFEKK